MKKAYLECLKKLRTFRKSLFEDIDKKITKDECQKRKEAITEIIELSKINGFRNMLRWARITRMKKISMLRVNFSGTIGTLDGIDMDAIAEKISTELGNKKTQ